MKVTCEIKKVLIDDAVITEENGRFYICQNVKWGAFCRDRQGYKRSWRILTGSEEDLKKEFVTNLKIIGGNEKMGKLNEYVVKLYPDNTEFAVLVDKHFGEKIGAIEFILLKDKQDELLILANELEKEEKEKE
jgi:hypothetical protein